MAASLGGQRGRRCTRDTVPCFARRNNPRDFTPVTEKHGNSAEECNHTFISTAVDSCRSAGRPVPTRASNNSESLGFAKSGREVTPVHGERKHSAVGLRRRERSRCAPGVPRVLPWDVVCRPHREGSAFGAPPPPPAPPLSLSLAVLALADSNTRTNIHSPRAHSAENESSVHVVLH